MKGDQSITTRLQPNTHPASALGIGGVASPGVLATYADNLDEEQLSCLHSPSGDEHQEH